MGAQARRRRLDGVWLKRVPGSAGRPRCTGRSQSSPADRLGGHCNRHQRRRVARAASRPTRPSSTGRAASSTSSMRRRRGSALRSCPAISATSSPRSRAPCRTRCRSWRASSGSSPTPTSSGRRACAPSSTSSVPASPRTGLCSKVVSRPARRPDMSMKVENIDISCQRVDEIDTCCRRPCDGNS